MTTCALLGTRCFSDWQARGMMVVQFHSVSAALLPRRENNISPFLSLEADRAACFLVHKPWHQYHLECALPLHLPIVMVWLLSVIALASVALVHATPVEVKRQAITTLSSTQVDTFALYTHFASAAYCHPSITRTWNCGGAFAHCSSFEKHASLKRCSHSQLPSGPRLSTGRSWR